MPKLSPLFGFPVAYFGICLAAFAQISVRTTRVEHAKNPLGIDAQPPRLSWQLVSSKVDQTQSAYHVVVASSAEKLAAGQGDLWDSGKVASPESIYIPYAGKALSSGQQCHWKVKVWNQSGVESAWSAPAHWSMGILKADDWKGKWIGYNPVAKRRLPKEGVLSKMNWEGTNWIWTSEGDATKDAPAGRRFFKFNFDLLKDKQVFKAYLRITADDQFRIYFNGQGVERTMGDDPSKPAEVECTSEMRNGQVKAMPIPLHDRASIMREIDAHTREGALYYTDQWQAYATLKGSPPLSRTLTRRPIEALRSVHVEAKEVQCGVQAWCG